MPENVETWWARRQRSKGVEVPYAVGQFRAEWERYPVLIRQYHPDLNSGITLTQVPPAADVYLLWQCDVGHLFVATPEEQRNRPGGQRRRSVWCTACAAKAAPQPVHGGFAGPPLREGPRSRKPRVKRIKPVAEIPVGEAFSSGAAPVPASAAEARLRQLLQDRIELDLSQHNAIRVGTPFFDRLELWPDILLTDLRVALEYDTTGRHGLEHVGGREVIDRRKDRILRSAGWEVIRIRCGKLRPLGPWDLVASGVTPALAERILDRLREIRGDLIVDSYLVRTQPVSRSRR